MHGSTAARMAEDISRLIFSGAFFAPLADGASSGIALFEGYHIHLSAGFRSHYDCRLLSRLDEYMNYGLSRRTRNFSLEAKWVTLASLMTMAMA